MKRWPVYLITLISPVLIGFNAYGQLPDEPSEGKFDDKNMGITYYLSRISDTDYYVSHHFLINCPDKAKEYAENKRDSIVAWGLTEKDIRSFDTKKRDRIIDCDEFAIIKQKYSKEGDSTSVGFPVEF